MLPTVQIIGPPCPQDCAPMEMLSEAREVVLVSDGFIPRP
jgi:hypothetical protein